MNDRPNFVRRFLEGTGFVAMSATLIHYGILRGWPLVTGVGVACLVNALIVVVGASVAIFGGAFADALNDEGINPS